MSGDYETARREADERRAAFEAHLRAVADEAARDATVELGLPDDVRVEYDLDPIPDA